MPIGDTPRTDAVAGIDFYEEFLPDPGPQGKYVPRSFAAELERDLARLTEENEALRKKIERAFDAGAECANGLSECWKDAHFQREREEFIAALLEYGEIVREECAKEHDKETKDA